MTTTKSMKTTTLSVHATRLGQVQAKEQPDDCLDELIITLDPQSPDAQHIRRAAEQIRTSTIPVAFPTETVYGLGADATRSDAVNGIYKAKQRPSDNPLIVHFASLQQIRQLLKPAEHWSSPESTVTADTHDPIPAIYRPLIRRFWPGPLTILLPIPPKSSLAPEVTAGLKTFGARIPRHIIALALLQLSGVPIAAPSANASTKPSPTAAEHVAFDLDGRIETIIDGGPSEVGVESTVVDGLSDTPIILRPGGISVEQIRACPGWETVTIGYKDSSEGTLQPKAPGMKYRHYSPKAPVILFEKGKAPPSLDVMRGYVADSRRIGIVRTRTWVFKPGKPPVISQRNLSSPIPTVCAQKGTDDQGNGFRSMLQDIESQSLRSDLSHYEIDLSSAKFSILDLELGPSSADIARGIFAALRELDRADVDAILIEGIDELEGDIAAAVMNRLRKAAEVKISPSAD